MDAQDVKQLVEDVGVIIRKEVDSAKTEMSEKIQKAGVGAGMLSAGAICGIFALGSLTALMILALSTGVAPWLAALIVTLIWGIIAAILALAGKKKIQEATPLAPTETIENIKEDVEWAQRGLRSASK